MIFQNTLTSESYLHIIVFKTDTIARILRYLNKLFLTKKPICCISSHFPVKVPSSKANK